MPRPRKPDDAKADRRPSRKRDVVPLRSLKTTTPPEPPKGLLKATQDLWREYWADSVSQAATRADMGLVNMWFETYDVWLRCSRLAKETPFVAGSKGQPRLNPAADRADRLAAVLIRLAGELGLSPYSRGRLGVQFGHAALTLEELNAQIDERRQAHNAAELDLATDDDGNS